MGRATREHKGLVPRRSRRSRQAQSRICSRSRAGQSRSHGEGPCSAGSAALALCPVSDGPALRLCMDRIYPARKDRPVRFGLPPIERAADAVASHAALVGAVARGDLTPSEAGELSKLVEGYVRAVEATDILDRLAKLEAATQRHGR